MSGSDAVGLMTDASADPDSAPATATPAATQPERALLDAANRMICPPHMRNESMAQQLDRYVETVVCSYARHFGDSGALVAWMEQQAALSRKHAAEPLDIARADLLEKLAVEIREARAPHARH
jgi:hypothetical protein